MAPHSSKRKLRGYNGGEPRYRAIRLRAAMACSSFNALPEDCSPSERAAAFKAVICPRDESDESSNGFPKENGPCSAPPATSASPATPPLTPALDPPSSALPGSGSQPCADAPRVPRASVPNFPDQSQSRTSDPAAMVRANSSGSVTRSPASARLETSVKEPSRHENLYPAHHGPYVKGPIYVDYGINVTIGSSTFINRNCHILDAPVASLVIGERCLLGPNVHLYNVTHTLDAGKRTDPSCDSSSLAGDIRIGDDCWIGGGATILPGVTIGNGACVGAGSVVTRDIPANHLAIGVPARVIRRLDCRGKNEADGSCEGLRDQIKKLRGIGSVASRSGDIGGIRSAKARIKKLEVVSVALTAVVIWLLYREAVRGGG